MTTTEHFWVTLDTAVPPTGTTVQYATTTTYDQLNRPLTFGFSPAPSQTTPTGASVTFTHGYNAVDQRISQGISDNAWVQYPTGPSTTSYTANSLNQYTAVGGTTPTYDSNGNLTYDGTFSYCYDAENRLVGVLTSGTCASPGTVVATYAYDAQGRRKSKTVNGTTTIYVTDADNREVLEYDGSTGQIQAWYAYGAGLDVINRIDVPGNTRQTFIPDIQGSVVATLASNTGALTKRNYLPFGESSTTTGSFAYTGLRIDPETNGLYYARARIYSPTLGGRFIQPDPIGYADGANLYAYVNNDPLNLIDPFGMAAERGGFGSAVAGTVSALADRVMAGETRDDLARLWSILNAPVPGCENCITGMPPLLGSPVGGAARGITATAGGAQNAATGPRLAQQLRAEQISSQFTSIGTLTPEAIANSRLIMQASRLGNPAIPSGFAKFTTAPLPAPTGGSVTTRFYMNPATREVFYGLDYKTLFLP